MKTVAAMKKLFLFLFLFCSLCFVGCAQKAEAPSEALSVGTPAPPSAAEEPEPPPPPPLPVETPAITPAPVVEAPATEAPPPPITEAFPVKKPTKLPLLLHSTRFDHDIVGQETTQHQANSAMQVTSGSVKPPVLAADTATTKSNNSALATVDQVVGSLEKANIAFNVPEKLNLKETAQIELLLSMRESAETLRNSIEAEGAREGATIKVSKRMEASLTGADFQITEITPKEQAVGSIETVNWKWDVKPTSLGQHPLHLTLTALVSVDGTTTRRAIRTFDKTIKVNVTATQWAGDFVAKNWQWLWAAIVLPLAGGVWKQWKPKGKSPE
jgi:hypothetical protein